MDPALILADVQLAIQLAQMAAGLAIDVGPKLKRAYDIATGALVLTDADRATMLAEEADMRTKIDAVIAADDAATD
jgi:hypothetical protein